jgi:anhydro-N-acetylmuramic acid kinase
MGRPILRAIGLMSGTSLDGVDAAWIETDGESVRRFGPALTLPYAPPLRARLRRLLDDAANGAGDVPDLADAVAALTAHHAEAVRALGMEADIVGFHGQTILHRPERHWTWQIGDGALLARLTGIDVINDFRSADVKAGGQGAPLMPLYHAVMKREAGLAEPSSPASEATHGGGARSSACDAKAGGGDLGWLLGGS